MKQIMRIGDEYVLVDKDIQAIADTSNAIQAAADKHETNVTAVIGKGTQSVTAVAGEQTTQRMLVELALLVGYVSETTGIDARTILDMIDTIMQDTSPDEP